MNQPWIYMCSPSWSPLLPPSPFLPSRFSQCTSPEHLSHASNLGWRSVSYLIIYMFHLLWLGSSFLGRVSEKARFALISSRYLSASYMSDVFKHSVTWILRHVNISRMNLHLTQSTFLYSLCDPDHNTDCNISRLRMVSFLLMQGYLLLGVSPASTQLDLPEHLPRYT